MKNVVVIGGGFAGVACCHALLKAKKKTPIKITLIDKNPYHLFTPSLYEVATNEVPHKNIALPYNRIFAEKDVEIVRGRVGKIDIEKQILKLTNDNEIEYDYLVISCGSVPAYYNIPGLLQNSIPFKSIEDAVKINKKLNLLTQELHDKRSVKLVIGGGGFAGTELAAEVLTFKKGIIQYNGCRKECLETTIIQGSDHLLKELNPRVSTLAQKRVRSPYVHFAFGGHIKEVDEKNIYTDDGKSYPYDVFVWTGGVEANHIALKNNLPTNRRGQILVDDYLRMQNGKTVFVAGDIAGFIDTKSQKPVPNVAQVAEEQGVTVAINIEKSIQEKNLEKYIYRHFGYIVPLRGRFAAAELIYGIHFYGFLGWVLQQFVFLRYLLGIFPLKSALKRWNIFELELEQ